VSLTLTALSNLDRSRLVEQVRAVVLQFSLQKAALTKLSFVHSTTFDEFARKWNKPVHEFLLRHIYLEAIDTYKLSKVNASYLTFFFSSCLHELVMAVVARKISLWFFSMQMLQIPLIWLGKVNFIKSNKTLGNAVFWFSLFVGPPLLALLYTRDYVKTTSL
jgi:sterol O-acyltransferase